MGALVHAGKPSRPSHQKNQTSASVLDVYATAEAIAAPVAPKLGMSRTSSNTVAASPAPIPQEFNPGRPIP